MDPIAVTAVATVLLMAIGIVVQVLTHRSQSRRADKDDQWFELLRRVMGPVPTELGPNATIEEPEEYPRLEKEVSVEVAKGTEIDCDLLLKFGNVEFVQGRLDSALHYYQVIHDQGEKQGNKRYVASAHGNIGLIYSDKGDLDEALRNHQAALEIDREIGYRQGEASALGNIGLIYSDKGGLDEALKNLKAALEIDREIGYRQGEANQLGNIGLIYSDKGDLDEALKNLQAALEILDKHGLAQGRGVIETAIAEIERQRGSEE